MAQRKQDIEDFSVPVREYQPHELQDFHNKIQKFWDEPRTLSDGSIARKFRHEDLAVAYGAAIKVKHGKSHVYLYNDRSKDLDNLMKQYWEWRKKNDWISEKQNADMEKLAEQEAVPF